MTIQYMRIVVEADACVRRVRDPKVAKQNAVSLLISFAGCVGGYSMVLGGLPRVIGSVVRTWARLVLLVLDFWVIKSMGNSGGAGPSSATS